MSAATRLRLSTVLCMITLMTLAYWVAGPPELARWELNAMKGDFNKGARALKKHVGSQAESAVYFGYFDKPTLPAMVQFNLSDTRKLADRRSSTPASFGEHLFTWFIAFDALISVVLAIALLWWRRDHAAAGHLGVTLTFFGFALACFLINGQSRLRVGPFDWPGWPRLLSDVAATLAFGFSLIGLEKFFSSYPVRLEDWHVLQSLLRWRGQSLVAEGNYRKNRTNLLSLARLVPRLILGVLLLGTVASTLPFLLADLRHTIDTRPDGTLMGWQEKISNGALVAGMSAGLIVFALLLAFGWLLSVSLAAKLRAARENCTEEERRQADWLFAGGLVVALMIGAFSFILMVSLPYIAWGPETGDWAKAYGGALFMLFFPAGWAIMLFALGGAVFLSKSFGPRPLLKRTILIAAAGVLMSLLLAGVQHFVTAKIMSRSAAATQQGMSTVLAGGMVVFSLGFFRNKMDQGIDGFLNRFMPATVIAEGKRRDATVMFSDLAGYTALSAKDEAHALHVAGLFQKSAADVARRKNGRIVKTIGDAVMWVFTTPAEAFAAAHELSAESMRSATAAKLPVLPVNSGVHHGSIVEAPDGDIYGASVNLAARLQGAAKDGAVVASSEAMLEVSGGFRFEPMGRLELKNVPTPIACFKVLPA